MIELNTSADIEVAPDELGRAFAASMSADQAEFLRETAYMCKDYNWALQSAMIVEHITNGRDARGIIDFLETLLDHLKDREYAK